MFTIEIATDNAAFEDAENEEVARILRKAADLLDAGYYFSALLDINGNRVGSFNLDGR